MERWLENECFRLNRENEFLRHSLNEVLKELHSYKYPVRLYCRNCDYHCKECELGIYRDEIWDCKAEIVENYMEAKEAYDELL